MSKRLAFLGISVLSGAAAFVACGFPDVSFAPDDGSEGGPSSLDGSNDGQTADGNVKSDAANVLPPDVDPEGGAKDATTIPDGSQQVDAAAGCCDCDMDSYKADGGTCGAPTGDCDDLNKYVRPAQDFVVSTNWTSTHTPTFDWDCSGAVTKQFAYNVNCAGVANCTAQGFTTDVPCGEQGDYVFCKAAVIGLLCTEDHREKRSQGCR
jgi:hypothetical protein